MRAITMKKTTKCLGLAFLAMAFVILMAVPSFAATVAIYPTGSTSGNSANINTGDTIALDLYVYKHCRLGCDRHGHRIRHACDSASTGYCRWL